MNSNLIVFFCQFEFKFEFKKFYFSSSAKTIEFKRVRVHVLVHSPAKVKLSKERAWKECEKNLDDDFITANEVFWQIIRRLRGKRSLAAFFIEDSNGATLKDQEAILSRWRECFSDLLNPLDATSTQINEEQVGEDIQITETDVNAVIKSLKTEKAPGEDNIISEMLKAMNMYGVRWLTHVCKVACRQ